MQPLMPRPGFWVLSLPLLREISSHELWREKKGPMPRHEGKISISALVANEVRLAGFLEVAVDDADHATDPANA